MYKDVIIIGGGAAGLFCALTAGQRGRSVLVLERAAEVGKKILISGGGRCNFTNREVRAENYLSDNPHFAKSALARFTPQHFIELVQRHRIAFHEKKLGQLFCDERAEHIVNLLLAECTRGAVVVQTGCHVEAIEPLPQSDETNQARFTVKTNHGAFTCASLVIATGGLSIPQMGATDFGYRSARQFGLRLVPTRPALVPLLLSEADRTRYAPLSGVSVDALVSHPPQSFRENILLTHQGLSGPAILQISSYWQPGKTIAIDLLPQLDVVEWLAQARHSARELKTLLAQHWPQRFAQAWCAAYAPAKPLAQYSKNEWQQLAERLQRWQVQPTGTAGYRKAEVTAGGVATAELSSQTMEARRVPGLYFIGEVVDVTGWLGGYNFQWAWASGHTAGIHC